MQVRDGATLEAELRIGVDTGGLSSPGFGGIATGLGESGNQDLVALNGAEGGAGNATLSSAITALANALASADDSAGMTVASLGKAVSNAAQSYINNENAISQAETPR